MKTIPTSWKPGGTTDRNQWYNTIGTPIVWIRIQSPTNTIRLSNERLKLHEEDGWAEYDDRFLDSIGAIDIALNFLQGKAGATGQMGQTDLVLRNHAQDGKVFNQLYDLDEFANAQIDIWFCPKECGTFDMDNVRQLFKGVLTNVVEKPNVITMTINEYSNIKHKKIPMRIDEFDEEKSMGWTVPEGSVAKVVPICFGTGIFKAYHCNTVDNGTRYYYVCYHYKDTRTVRNLQLYYWIQEKKKYVAVPLNDFDEVSYLGGDIYLARFDIEALAIYEEMRHYILPTDVYVNPVGGQPTAINKEKLHDKKKASTGDASKNVPGKFTEDVYVLCYIIKFNKNSFNLKGNFDLYVVADVAHKADGYKRWETKFTWSGNAIEQLQSQFDYDSGQDFYYCAWIPEDYINEGYDPNEPMTAGLLKKNVSPDELNSIVQVSMLHKSLLNPISNRPLYTYEVALVQVMLNLPRDFYVKDNFENNALQSAIEYLFTNFLNIASANIVFENFQSDYKIDGQIFLDVESYDNFARLAEDFGLIFFEDEDGKERFIDIAPADTVYEITDDDILTENKEDKIEKYRTELDVFSAFFVDYRKNYASDEYEASKYVTKDNENLSHIDADLMKGLCKDAYDYYGSEKRMTIKLDTVRDAETAELILGKLVQFYSRKRIIITMTTTFKLMDLEVGDQVRINTTFFSSSNNFYVAKKTYVFNFEAKRIDIEFVFFEAPWTGSGLVRSIDELVQINESYTVIKTHEVTEQVSINESVEYKLIPA